jgi:hypothetical protein
MLVVILDLLCLAIFVYTTAVTGCGVEDHSTSPHPIHPTDVFHPLGFGVCVYVLCLLDLDKLSLSSLAL